MAIIDKDTRMTVATRLANLNYKEQMDSSLAKLNELFEKYIIGKTPDDVLKCFKAHKKFFIRCNEPSLSSYNLPKTFFPEDWGSRGFYIHLKFTQELPIADEKVEDIAKKLSEDHPIVQQIKEHLLLERDRYFMEKRLKCMMETTRFTPERLKNEFPEAYLIYMDVITADWNEKRDDAKKPASNLCDTIENIRATLKPNLKEALNMIKKRNKLGWFLRWYYSHLLFAAQYVSFKDAGLEELFWNIVTWYHFFRHFEEFTCKIQWYVSKDMVAYIFIRNLADWSTKSICFNDKPCPLVQVTENLDCYKQVDGAIYEISNGSPVE